MTTKQQWMQGLQWGGVAWLGYILWHVIPNAAHVPCADFVAEAVAWSAATVLLMMGARAGRPALAGAIVVQILTGTVRANHFGGPVPLAWALTFWLPMVLPIVPLLFIAPERPRLTVALALVGRWRDAWATLAGFRWVIVGYLLLTINREMWVLLLSIAQHQELSRLPMLDLTLLAIAAVPSVGAPVTAA